MERRRFLQHGVGSGIAAWGAGLLPAVAVGRRALPCHPARINIIFHGLFGFAVPPTGRIRAMVPSLPGHGLKMGPWGLEEDLKQPPGPFLLNSDTDVANTDAATTVYVTQPYGVNPQAQTRATLEFSRARFVGLRRAPRRNAFCGAAAQSLAAREIPLVLVLSYPLLPNQTVTFGEQTLPFSGSLPAGVSRYNLHIWSSPDTGRSSGSAPHFDQVVKLFTQLDLSLCGGGGSVCVPPGGDLCGVARFEQGPPCAPRRGPVHEESTQIISCASLIVNTTA